MRSLFEHNLLDLRDAHTGRTRQSLASISLSRTRDLAESPPHISFSLRPAPAAGQHRTQVADLSGSAAAQSDEDVASNRSIFDDDSADQPSSSIYYGPSPSEFSSPDEVVAPTDTEMFATVDVGPTLSPEEQARRDQDALLDRLLDDKSFPLESFLTDLEQMMSSGETPLARRLWARHKGVSQQDLARYEKIIRGTWNVEGTSMFVYLQRKEELRQQYQQIYRDCLVETDDRPAQLGIALKVVDSIAKLDGIVGPDVQVSLSASATAAAGATAVNATVDTRNELTNRTRERVQELFVAMRQRAENHSARVSASIAARQGGATLAKIVDQSATQKTRTAEQGDLLDAPSDRVMTVVPASNTSKKG